MSRYKAGVARDILDAVLVVLLLILALVLGGCASHPPRLIPYQPHPVNVWEDEAPVYRLLLDTGVDGVVVEKSV